MATTSGSQVVARAVSGACIVVGAAALATCSPGAGQGYPKVADCRIEVYETRPGPNYVEVGQFSLAPYGVGAPISADTQQRKHKKVYKSATALLADMRADFCAVGGDMLVIERNALGEIVYGTVYRRAELQEMMVPPPPPPVQPSKSERCEPECGPGLTCEGGTCVELCVPACADGTACGDDRVCHPVR